MKLFLKSVIKQNEIYLQNLSAEDQCGEYDEFAFKLQKNIRYFFFSTYTLVPDEEFCYTSTFEFGKIKYRNYMFYNEIDDGINYRDNVLDSEILILACLYLSIIRIYEENQTTEDLELKLKKEIQEMLKTVHTEPEENYTKYFF